MKGKEKCKALKEIRRQIAEKNDIPYVVSQCKYQGDCLGTCPKCEAELRYLERELAIRQGLGKAVAVAGISISVCASLTACTSTVEDNEPDSGYEDIAGNIVPYNPGDEELVPETDIEKPEDNGPDSPIESQPNSLENEEEPEIEGRIEKIGGLEVEEGNDETNEPLDTDDLAGDIDINLENE